MPLLVRENIGDAVIAIWKIEEKQEDFLRWLDDASVDEYVAGVKSVRRRLEIAASRYLFRYISGDDYDTIAHDDTGKPYLPSGRKHISVSHTDGYVAIALGTGNIGIDIETCSGRAFRLKEHFLSDEEIFLIDDANPSLDAVLRWSAKEAVYKVVGRGVYDFRNTIFIDGFTVSDEGLLSAHTVTGGDGSSRTMKVFFRNYGDFVLTLCNGCNP